MLQLRYAVWLLLVGCSQSSLLSYKSDTGTRLDSGSADDETGGSTGDVIEQDPDYGDDGGSGSGGDSGDDGGSGDGGEVTYDLSHWTGSRTYSIDKRAPTDTDCTGDTIDESGVRIEDQEEIEALEEYCPICADFYEVTYQSTRSCGGDIDLSLPEVRGLVYRGTDLEMWRIVDEGTAFDAEREFNDGPYDDGTATYSFERDWNGDGTTTITGTLTFAEAGG